MTVRVIDGTGRLRLLPLGLLDLDGNGNLLGKRVDIIQPLPMEREADSDACVDPVLSVRAEELSPLPGCSDPSWTTTAWEQFERLLGAPQVGDPEGLLLVGHQRGGDIALSDTPLPRAKANDLRHVFAPGSVAILLACELGVQVDEGTIGWLERLNEQGVDAVIASPFPVMGELAACLANHYSATLRATADQGERIDVATLHRRAVAAMVANLEETNQTALVPFLYEFSLAGDPSVQLCPR